MKHSNKALFSTSPGQTAKKHLLTVLSILPNIYVVFFFVSLTKTIEEH